MNLLCQLTLMLPVVAMSAACDASPQHTAPQHQAKAPVAAVRPGAPVAESAPPSPQEVLRNIYMGQGPMPWRYETKSGTYHDDEFESEMGFWKAVEFTQDGHRYFTGFTYKTPDGPFNDPNEAPGPISIDQATFLHDNERWRIVDTGFVGELEVNRSSRWPRADSHKAIADHALADGRRLIAIPTREFQNGVDLSAYLIFRFQPQGMAPSTRRKQGYPNGGWSLIGTIPVGEDNGATCDGGAVVPCIANGGALQFRPNDAELPDIHVARTGTEIAAPGKARRVVPTDHLLYRFDVTRDAYVRHGQSGA
ncbi:hypothetical protein JQK15_20115 [Sphingobium sp. BHU LFT2]|uniref:hypothetical protein n=1 Tax=Sphingobium sp. BHU LFT2 TaxID=2807634 RepID=UPI001BE84ACC|nr:hypothetical protein [Sphingobium sp. BHU LFT2]MBT2245823.1 hypothetical protein [Sphingobium sp. BHU LFT2]